MKPPYVKEPEEQRWVSVWCRWDMEMQSKVPVSVVLTELVLAFQVRTCSCLLVVPSLQAHPNLLSGKIPQS